MLRGSLLVLAAVGLALAACNERPSRRPASAPPAAAVPARVAAPAAPVASEIREVDAPALFAQLRSRRKRGTVVNVWASWCGSCREEIPLLLQIEKAIAADGIDFVFVTADESPDFPKAVELMRSWSGPLPVFAVAGAMTPFKRAMHPSWKGAIPATFLFDDAQKLRHFWEGPVLEHEITPILQGFLAGEPVDGETRPPITGENE
jgi:thiol-disulfide isomerase/thioredoxin